MTPEALPENFFIWVANMQQSILNYVGAAQLSFLSGTANSLYSYSSLSVANTYILTPSPKPTFDGGNIRLITNFFLEDGVYFRLGQLMAMAVIHGGAAVRILSPLVFNYLSGMKPSLFRVHKSCCLPILAGCYSITLV